MSFKIKSELNESQIESDIASYLGYITPIWSSRYRLFSLDEQIFGADKLFDRFIPIYMQFKVSQGLNPNTNVLRRFRNKPLYKIISFRNHNNIYGNPILYFKLRKQAKTADDLQHNILFNLHKPPYQYALYVAPLTLELNEYEKLMEFNWHRKLFPFKPYDFRRVEILDTTLLRNFNLGKNPFLRAHISFPPHELANTSNHYYSFSKNGSDIAWHGGKTVAGDYRLSSQLLKIFNNSYRRKEFGVDKAQYLKIIGEFTGKNYDENEFYDQSNEVSNQIIQDFSFMLKEKFNIRLMFLSKVDK